MEKISEKTHFLDFSLAVFVGVLIFQRICSWIINFHKFDVRLLSFLRTQLEFSAQSKVYEEKRSSSSETEDNRSIVSSQQFCLDEKLSRDDIEIVMEKLGLLNYSEESDESDETIKDLWGFDEITSMFAEKEPSLEELKEAFCVFDENRDGFIDPEELQKVVLNLGFMEGLKVAECERMIRVSDENGDGKIDFNEFVKFMERSFS